MTSDNGVYGRTERPGTPPAALWDPPSGRVREGEASGPNGKVYYRIHGEGPKKPAIVLHGGPAAGHIYMRPYAALLADRPVVLYDQSDSGLSARPEDIAAYTVETYVAELEALRRHLGFAETFLVGHSWGGMLALAYALEHPGRVAGLVLAGTAPVLSDFADAARLWLHVMGPDAYETVRRAEETGQQDDPAYRALQAAYYRKHFCRLDPWPGWLMAELEKAGSNPVYAHLNGPSEFQFTGALRTLDLRPGLHRIAVPTLVTCGEYDAAPPWIAHGLAASIPNARLQIFEGLSHMTHVEDPARVIEATRRFLAEAEAGAGA